ncbi:MAG: sigma-54 dependent transcriptional regulator [Victivallaceae bacterium]|nr:sigma-54 dependent transcriptional regulator [Victivallaceae bacterium]
MSSRVKLAVSQEKLHELLVENIRRQDLLLIDSGKVENIEQLLHNPGDILIITDDNIPAPPHESLKTLLQSPAPPSIIVLSSGDPDARIAMLALGCEAVLSLRASAHTISRAVDSIVMKHVHRQNEIIDSQRMAAKPKLSDFVSRNSSMQVFLNTVKKVVNCDSSLLILGETGVGKERLALAIHGENKRNNYPFIAINCAALPETLLESELFGHEKGAFTGALKARRGAFEQANRGTLFLDEIGDMPLHLQSKLLRVLQEKQFLRIGGETMIKVDVRIMAATNRDLAEAVREGTFRKDLFYRLSVICLTIPPLSERREDIAELVRNYIAYLAPRIGVEVNGIEDAALNALVNYNWPGNVRELINVIERALLLCEGKTITLSELPEDISMKTPHGVSGRLAAELTAAAKPDWVDAPWKAVRNKMMAAVEKKYFTQLLKRHEGKVAAAAKTAGISPRAFYQKLSRHSITGT